MGAVFGAWRADVRGIRGRRVRMGVHMSVVFGAWRADGRGMRGGARAD